MTSRASSTPATRPLPAPLVKRNRHAAVPVPQYHFLKVSSHLMPHHCRIRGHRGPRMLLGSWASVALSRGERRCSATNKHTHRILVSLSRNLGRISTCGRAARPPLFFLVGGGTVVGAIIKPAADRTQPRPLLPDQLATSESHSRLSPKSLKSSSYPATFSRPHWRRAMHLPVVGTSTVSTRHQRGFWPSCRGGAAHLPRWTGTASVEVLAPARPTRTRACMGPTPDRKRRRNRPPAVVT